METTNDLSCTIFLTQCANNMLIAKTPEIVSQISIRDLYWRGDTTGKKIYLTFDDGPIPGITGKALDLLEKYGAKATFFMVGHNVMKHPDIAKLVIERGHSIGNHSFNHLNGWKTSNLTYAKNILQASKFIDSNLLRPPYGRITPAQVVMLRKKYKIVMWSILSGDYDQSRTPKECLETIVRHAEPGSIVVLHDSQKAEKNMLYSLQGTLELLNEYDFVSLGDFFGGV